MLRYQVKDRAIKIASRLIIKIARQIADSGCRSGKLALVRGFDGGADIELDASLDNYIAEPERGILDSLVCHLRQREKQAFIMMFDHSFSMKGMKIILAAITAAVVAQHFKRDYAILAFSNRVSVLKAIHEPKGPEEVLQRLFGLQLDGDTDIRLALETGFQHLEGFDMKKGLLLTDGAWNRGGNPLVAAARFDKLSVIGFPPARAQTVRRMAAPGNGGFFFVEDEKQIAEAILTCLD